VVEASGSAYTLIGAQPIEVFSEWIDALLAGREPPGAAAQRQQEKPELPFWARPEGLAPDPAHPGRTLAGDRYKGNPAARLVLVEFADFECPACERHALATQPLVDQRFVDTGDVLWVMKHFPLRAHPHAPAAAAAAECAGAQKKFWRMHQALYETSAQWSQARDVEAALARIGASIGLGKNPVGKCLASRRSLVHVLRVIFVGEAFGIKALPAFILLRDGVGHVMTGARSPEEFAATLQEQLGRTKGESGASPAVAKAR
jgi:protein-disulfide isomerase